MQELLQRANRLHQAGDLSGAESLYRKILEQDAANVCALYALTLILLQSERLDEASRISADLTERHSEVADVWNLRANIRARLGEWDEALASFDRALTLDPTLVAAHLGRSDLLAHLGRYEEARQACRNAVSLDPVNPVAVKLLGQLHLRLGELDEAEYALRVFLAANPKDANTYIDLGIVLSRLGREEEALQSFDAALTLSPDNPAALYNRGNLLCTIGRYEAAAADCARAVELAPDFDFTHGTLLWARLQENDWTDFEALCETIAAKIDAGRKVINPQQYLSVATSPQTLFACAQTWSRSEYPAHPMPIWRGELYEHEQIRVAYMSADFARHATADWIAGVFEHHDRKRFRTIAISLAPDDGSAMRKRLAAAFDEFIDAERMGDAEIASLIRELEVDILIDLKGYTQGSRMGVLARRPATIQVAYIGYPGPTGADYLDYILADRTVIPREHFPFFSEQVVWLPHTYVCNDDKRPAIEPAAPRAQFGLPDTGFVFCCFNANYKILPPTFDSWMRILGRTEESVLWLLKPSDMAAANLRREAEARGVDSSRLIFAPREPLKTHLSRLAQADLVLDTLPYNAHTTAADALWAGVPVLTRLGTTFPGRVAASVLNAIGLPELVVTSSQEFEDMACRLANMPAELARLRAALAGNRETQPLFDTARFTRNLEKAYLKMWETLRAGGKPMAFAVADRRRKRA